MAKTIASPFAVDIVISGQKSLTCLLIRICGHITALTSNN